MARLCRARSAWTPGGVIRTLALTIATACDVNGTDDPTPCTSKDSKLTVTGSELTASVTDVLPNETITITGNGFGTQTCIDPRQNPV